MIEIELTRDQVDFLFTSLKMAESGFTEAGNYKACKTVSALHASLHKQIFTYGQADEDE